MSNNIKLSVTFAKWVMTTARTLVSHMYSQEYDPATGSFIPNEGTQPPSMFERLPGDDVELRYWVNTIIQFAKTLAGVMKHELVMLENVEVLDFYSEIENLENDDL